MLRIKKQWLLLVLCVLLVIWYWQATYPNYGKLEALLAASKWQEADQQTTDIILKDSNWGVFNLKMWVIALATDEFIGSYQPIKQYPCDNLKKLDNLWLKYSDGRFGLSVQQRIFKRFATQLQDEFEIYDAFIDEVGWDRSDSSSKAPVGRFPSDDWVQATTYGEGDTWILSARYLYDRIEECQISPQ
jgi:hypothetical protein